MQWVQKDNYYEVSDCGRYTVSRAYTAGRWLYTAWRIATPMGHWLGNRESQQECEQLCDLDRAEHVVAKSLDTPIGAVQAEVEEHTPPADAADGTTANDQASKGVAPALAP